MKQIDSLKTGKKFKKTEIGEIPVDWEVVKLKEIAEIGSGDSAPQGIKYFANSEYLFIRTSDVGQVRRSHCFGISVDKVNDLAVQKFGLHQWPKGTILFPKSGASTFLNHRVLLSRPAYVSSHLAAIVAKNQAVAEFLYYYLLTIDAKSLVPASNYPSLRLGDLATLSVPFPSFSEQKKIAEILTTVDETIEKSNEIIGKTKELKKSLMQELLTRGIGHKKFKKTQIGEMPVDWKVKRLVDIVGGSDVQVVAGPFGSNLKVSDYRNEGVPIIRLQNIEKYKFIEKEIKYTSPSKAKELSYHSFKKGDVVLAKLGDPIGKTCIIPESIGEGIVVADVVRVRINPQFVNTNYIMYALNSKNIFNQLNTEIIGTTRPRVNLGQVRNLLLPAPPLAEQIKIAEILISVDEQIEKETANKEKFEMLKKGLMQVLLTGKKRVKV